MTDAYREASKYETRCRRADIDCEKQIAAAIERAQAARDAKKARYRAELSPPAARVVVASEGEPTTGHLAYEVVDGKPVLTGDTSCLSSADPNPAPDWLNKEPAPLPAGSLLEVADKPRRRA